MSAKRTPQELAVNGFTHDAEGNFGITVAEPEKVRVYKGMRLREVLLDDDTPISKPPIDHDAVAHGYKALSQTGYVTTCNRCTWLLKEYADDMEAIQAAASPTPGGGK